MRTLAKITALATIVVALAGWAGAQEQSSGEAPPPRPNILFAISDDQSWRHVSALGAAELSTPAFDRVAREGILFENAYCAAPSCAPSRAAILTGQDIWRLEEGGLLFGALPRKFPIFTQALAEAGYRVAHTAKGYDPANKTDPRYWNHPLLEEYDSIRTPEVPGFLDVDYAANFGAFLEDRAASEDPDQPFFFWYGGKEPHREYDEGAGRRAGKDLSRIEVPGFLPDDSITRSDLADYYYEIEHFDTHLGRMLDALEAAGELDNTLVIVTSDNGMPFPYAKTTLYEHGIHMPLAVRWGDRVAGGRRVADFVNFIDFAPTFLELAGAPTPAAATGRSLTDLLYGGGSGFVGQPERHRVVTGWERHTWCRPGGLTYPSRQIREDNWTYIVNYEPDRWPGGDPDYDSPHQGIFGDIDAGSLREWMIANRDAPAVTPHFARCFGKRPRHELYDLARDPDQLRNLADDPSYRAERDHLAAALDDYLRRTGDPRVDGHDPWVDYPYYFPGYDTRHRRPVGEREPAH